MNKKVKVAFIGAGRTTKAHIKAFIDIHSASIIGIYNRTFTKAQVLADEFSIPQVFLSIEELYRQGKPDLVVVCISEPAKLSVLLQCIPHKVPILAEKPIGLNYDESFQIISLTKQVQCPFWVALNRRCYSSTRQALQILNEQPKCKRIIEITDQQDLTLAKSLGHSVKTIENWMYANSIHLIDFFSIFARNDLKNITILNPKIDLASDFIAAHLQFSSGDEGIYKAYWNRPGPWGCTVSIDNAFIELKPLEQGRVQKRENREWLSLEESIWDKTFKPGFRMQAEQAIQAVLGQNHFLATAEEALKSTSLVQKIYQSL